MDQFGLMGVNTFSLKKNCLNLHTPIFLNLGQFWSKDMARAGHTVSTIHPLDYLGMFKLNGEEKTQ